MPAGEAAEVQDPRRGLVGAAAAELPARDLELAEEVGLIAGHHVVEVVIADRVDPLLRVGERERDRPELEVDPLRAVATVVAEAVEAEVLRPRLRERQRGIPRVTVEGRGTNDMGGDSGHDAPVSDHSHNDHGHCSQGSFSKPHLRPTSRLLSLYG
jgi:hypothetical protein